MKCYECIHNDVCLLKQGIDGDACHQSVSKDYIEKLEHKLTWLLSYITDGPCDKTSYTIEEMQEFVAATLDNIEDSVLMREAGDIEEYKHDITNLREENIALKRDYREDGDGKDEDKVTPEIRHEFRPMAGRAAAVEPVLKGGSRLPSGYTELEYIESTGTQYVDTGVVPNNNTWGVLDIDKNRIEAAVKNLRRRTERGEERN